MMMVRPEHSTWCRLGLVAVAALSLGLAGCDDETDGSTAETAPANAGDTTATEAPLDDAGALSERAQGLWLARQKETWEEVFSYRRPSEREGLDVAEYVTWAKENEPFIVGEYVIHDAVVDGTIGWVDVDAELTFRKASAAPPNRTRRWETWMKVGETWHPVPPPELEAYPMSPTLRDSAAEAELRPLVEASARARLAREWETLYDMVEPDDTAMVVFEEFASVHEQLLFEDWRLEWIEVAELPEAAVRIAYLSKPNDPSMKKAPPQWRVVMETWRRIDGEWYWDMVRAPATPAGATAPDGDTEASSES